MQRLCFRLASGAPSHSFDSSNRAWAERVSWRIYESADSRVSQLFCGPWLDPKSRQAPTRANPGQVAPPTRRKFWESGRRPHDCWTKSTTSHPPPVTIVTATTTCTSRVESAPFAMSSPVSRALRRCVCTAKTTAYVRPSVGGAQQRIQRRWASAEAANPKISTIVDQISQLTLLETADLVSTLKVRMPQ